MVVIFYEKAQISVFLLQLLWKAWGMQYFFDYFRTVILTNTNFQANLFFMKKLIFTLFFAAGFTSLGLYAQQAVVSSGNYHENEDLSISWSLGETVIETFVSDDFILTQGFQQTSLIVTSVDDIAGLDLGLSAYPNPTSDYLTLSLKGEAPENITYELYDLAGRHFLSGELKDATKDISFRAMDPGIYFLRVNAGGQPVKTFKIVKQ